MIFDPTLAIVCPLQRDIFTHTGIHSVAKSGESETIKLATVIERLRDAGRVPLGIVSYNVEKERMDLHLFWNIDSEEANALLEKAGLEVIFNR